jgi:hypothetical protein
LTGPTRWGHAVVVPGDRAVARQERADLVALPRPVARVVWMKPCRRLIFVVRRGMFL